MCILEKRRSELLKLTCCICSTQQDPDDLFQGIQLYEWVPLHLAIQQTRLILHQVAHTQSSTIASRRTPVKVGQSLAKCPTLEMKFSFRLKIYALCKELTRYSGSSYWWDSPPELLLPQRHRVWTWITRLNYSIDKKRHLQPPGMLTNLHSLPSLQGIVGTGVWTDPTFAAAPSCRYLKQAFKPGLSDIIVSVYTNDNIAHP